MSGRQYLSGAAKRKKRSENEMKRRTLEELGWVINKDSQVSLLMCQTTLLAIVSGTNEHNKIM